MLAFNSKRILYRINAILEFVHNCYLYMSIHIMLLVVPNFLSRKSYIYSNSIMVKWYSNVDGTGKSKKTIIIFWLIMSVRLKCVGRLSDKSNMDTFKAVRSISTSMTDALHGISATFQMKWCVLEFHTRLAVDCAWIDTIIIEHRFIFVACIVHD